jgi:hypothetical protein
MCDLMADAILCSTRNCYRLHVPCDFVCDLLSDLLCDLVSQLRFGVEDGICCRSCDFMCDLLHEQKIERVL